MTAGIIAATALITATTIDDAVWLIPYCSSPQLPTSTKVVHALTFILTLETLSVLCVVAAKVFKDVLLKMGGTHADPSFILGLAGAIICYCIAGFLYVKKLMKRRRRAMAAAKAAEVEEEKQKLNENENDEETGLLAKKDEVSETAEIEEDVGNDDSGSSSDDSSIEGRDIPTKPSIRMVATLTALGALDEISYFPALVVGKVFSGEELLVGTLGATVIILVIVLLFLSKMKRLVDFLDSIPLYGIVGMFAVILTIGLFSVI